MYFQKQPEVDHYIKKYTVSNYRSPTHLHSFFELFFCTQGVLPINIAGKDYFLQPGEAVIIFPFQLHSIPVAENGYGCLFTFDSIYIESFASHFSNYLPKDNSFRYSISPDTITAGEDIFTLKAFLYQMCADVVRQCEFEYVSSDSRALLNRIFTITEERFADSDFSLAVLSEMMSYDYAYISKYFLRKTGIRYNHYLNQRRVTYAAKLLRKGLTESITDAAYMCGYRSLRSFNRNFKEIFEKTPQSYVKEFRR